MNAYQVRINMNHMRHEVRQDFIGTKDVLTRCVIADLAIVHYTMRPLDSIIMEDYGYNQLLRTALYQPSLEHSFELLGVIGQINSVALDIYAFIEEFIVKYHKPNKSCYVLVTIDSSYHLIITIKDI